MDLKAFKGTAVVAALLLVALLVVRYVEKPPEELVTGDKLVELFVFEKQDLVQARVTRPDGAVITLLETDQGWIIEETGFRASKSMVNRVKHQLHDLTARATVLEEAEDPALYGLGESAVKVELSFRDGRVESFLAGDPNPSSVSYYIQPLDGGTTIFTVKKSAVDYYSLSLNEFRERRFVGFNSKDADRIDAHLPGGKRLVLQRTGEKTWVMTEPEQMAVSLNEARSLLGRVAVLKAVDFVADQPEDLSPWSLDEPRASITISFGAREPVTLLVGTEVAGDEDPPLSHMMVQGGGAIYTAKDSFLQDYLVDPAELRDRAFMNLADDEVVEVTATMHRSEDPLGVGEVPLKRVGDVWQWYDGKPVPGSTPRRLADRASSVEAEEFVEDQPKDLGPYGLDEPRATLRLVSDTGEERVLLLGDDAAPRETLDQERTMPRLYAMRQDQPNVYVIDAGVLGVTEDALREQRRKLKNDSDREERHERMEEEMEDVGEDG